MHLYQKLLSLALLFLLSGCFASQGEVTVLQGDIDEVKTRTFRIEKDLAAIRSTTREDLEKQAAGVREETARLKKSNTDFQEGLQKELETFRKGTADLQATLDAAKVDMRVLTGKIDEMALQVKKPADDLTFLREDLDRRLAALDERLKKLEKESQDLEKKGAAKKEAESPDAVYQQGLKALKEGNPLQARDLMTKFIELFPSHELVPNVRYWIGEAYYSEKNYEQAILEFQQLIKDYPGKGKVPAAMLKQAMAFKELGDAKSARFVYGRLLEEYPSAPEAKIAKDKLKELK